MDDDVAGFLPLSHPPTLTPSTDRTRPPDFNNMSSGGFEALACALLDKEPGVTRADLYGTPHQKQFGIDAYGETPSGLIVASCKCYGTVRRGQVAEWSDDFLKHLDAHWRPHEVRKFILCVAAPMHSVQRLADIEAERRRFADLGLEYDVWAPRQLQERLREHPGIVSQHLGPEWEPRLCGRVGGAMRSATASAASASDDLDAQMAALREALSGAVEQQIDAAAQDLDDGRVGAIAERLAGIRSAPEWQTLSARARARTLRLQASLLISTGDLAAAEVLSDEAEAILAQEEPRLRALIAMHQLGPQEALRVLGEPTTEHGRTLRVGLLLNSGDLDLAEAALDALDDEAPETLRLRGFLHLLRGDPSTAFTIVERAEAKAPRRVAVRRLGAMARYAMALSPKAPTEAMVFPQPLARNLVRKDDQSQARLHAAYETFAQLNAEGGDAPEMDRVWAIACLCNLVGRSAAAGVLCKETLAETPASPLAIGWALARGLDFDQTHALDAIKIAIRGGITDLNMLRAFEWLAQDREPADAEAWLAQLPPVEGTPEVAAEISAVADRMRQRRLGEEEAEPTIAALDEAHRTGDWSRVESELGRLAADGQASPFLLAVADELAGAGRWDALAHHVDNLANFATADAIRIAAFVAFNTGRPDRAAALLRDHLDDFPGARLPFDLRRLEARALAAVGSAPEALRRADALAGETGDLADQLLQAELRFSIGDVGGAAPAIRAALNSGALSPADALRWSDRFVGEDLELARALWRAAVVADLSDELALGAVNLAFQLNLAQEQPALMGRLQRLAVERPDLVQTPSLDDLLDQMRQRVERVDKLDDIWTRGEAPVHIVLSALKANLADLYHLEPPPWMPRRPLFVRHGGRGPDFGITTPFRSWRLSLDITGLLLAEQLGLLTLMDDLGVAVRVSAAMPAALLTLEDRSRPNQPSRIAAARAVAEAVADGRISVRDGPSTPMRVAHDPATETGTAISLADVLAGLLQAGAIDQDAANAARPILGAPETATNAPAPGAPLLFEMGTLDLASEAQVLGAISGAFDVWVEPPTAANLRAQIAHAARGESLADWLAGVRRYVRDRIESGRYGLAPSVVRAQDDADPDVEINDPVLLTVLDVVRGAGAPGDFVWIDDRNLSGYANTGAATIVGVFDVLVRLHGDGELSDRDYYARLRRLRAGGALFVPITSAEVMHHLTAAPIFDGRLIETPALAALRRNVALALLHEDRLKVFEAPGLLAGRPNELPFILGLRRLAETTILEIWSAGPDLDAARARSDWAWSSLRAEHLRRGQGPAVDTRLFPALNIAGIAASAVHLAVLGARGRLALRRAFMAWLDETVVTPRLTDDPGLADETARMTAMLIQSAARPAEAETRDQRVQLRMRQLLRHTVALFPALLRDKVASDPQVRRIIGLKTPLAIKLKGVAIPVDRFWKGVRDAVCYGRAHLRDTAGRRVRLARQASPTTIQLTGAVRTTLVDPAFAAFARDPSERQVGVDAFLDEVDVPKAERGALVGDIEASPTAAASAKIIEDERNRSVMTFGRRLTEGLGRNEQISLSLFDPPPASSWLRFLRWPREPDADPIEHVATVLTSELGAWKALGRLAALPVLLPKWLYKAAMLAPERASHTVATARTPMLGLHRLHVEALDPSITDANLGEEVDALLAGYQGPAAIFSILLRWGARRFESQHGWRDLPPSAKVAVIWSYADCVTDILCSLPLDQQATASLLGARLPPRHLIDSLTLLSGVDDSALSPSAIYAEPLLMAGLEFALGDRFATLEPTETRRELFFGFFGALLDDGRTVSRPMRAFESAANPLPTWLSRLPADYGPFGSTLLGDAFVAEAIETLGKDPTDVSSWLYLLAWGPPGVPPEAAGALAAVFTTFDIEQFVEAAGTANLRAVAEVAATLGGEAASAAILDQLVSFAEKRARATSGADHEPEWLHPVLEAGASASKSFEPGRGVERFCQFTARLMAVAPLSALALRNIFDAVIDQTPTDQAVEVWQALLTARSY